MMDLNSAIRRIDEEIFSLNHAKKTLEKLAAQGTSAVSIPERRQILDDPLQNLPPVTTTKHENASPDEITHKNGDLAHKKGAKSPPGVTAQLIISFLKGNPDLGAQAIADGTHLPESTISFHLTRLKKQGLLTNENRKWRAADSKPPGTPQKAMASADRPFGCDKCDRTFRERHSLDSHKQLHHGEK
jgi:hypothetical protein